MIPKKISFPHRAYPATFLKLKNFENFIFFLVIFFSPTQLGKHFWPQFSYIFSLKIDYLSPTIYFWDILLLVLIITWGLKKSYVNKLALGLLLFFLLTQMVSLFEAENIGAGFVRLYQLSLAGLFGLYISSKKFPEISKLLVLGLLPALLFQSGLAIAQFFKGGSIGFWVLGERAFSLSTLYISNFNFYGQILLRPYGTFSHPNVLAAFIALTFPLLVTFAPAVVRTQAVTSLALGVAFVAGLLTFSRGAILSLIAQAIIFSGKNFKWLLLFLLIISPVIFTRFGSVFNFDNLSVTRREDLASVALHQFWENPLFGSGANNFINHVANSSLVSGPSRFLQPVHNIFLLVLSEGGIVGLIGFLILIGIPIRKIFLTRKSQFKRTLLLMWSSLILLGMFDHYFITLPQGQRLLFLTWGLSMLEYSNETLGKDPDISK